jgi:hypothetical protein
MAVADAPGLMDIARCVLAYLGLPIKILMLNMLT